MVRQGPAIRASVGPVSPGRRSGLPDGRIESACILDRNIGPGCDQQFDDGFPAELHCIHQARGLAHKDVANSAYEKYRGVMETPG